MENEFYSADLDTSVINFTKVFKDFNKLKELQKEFKTLFQLMQEGNFFKL